MPFWLCLNWGSWGLIFGSFCKIFHHGFFRILVVMIHFQLFIILCPHLRNIHEGSFPLCSFWDTQILAWHIVKWLIVFLFPYNFKRSQNVARLLHYIVHFCLKNRESWLRKIRCKLVFFRHHIIRLNLIEWLFCLESQRLVQDTLLWLWSGKFQTWWDTPVTFLSAQVARLHKIPAFSGWNFQMTSLFVPQSVMEKRIEIVACDWRVAVRKIIFLVSWGVWNVWSCAGKLLGGIKLVKLPVIL